jgi:hypothetical protein
MKKKCGFTREGHYKTAKELIEARDAVMRARERAMVAYPINSMTYKRICGAGKAMDALLMALQDESEDEGHFTQYCASVAIGWN